MSNYSIATEIWRQLGNMFKLMTGAKSPIAVENGLGFKIGGGAKNGINYIQITLNARDLYDVKFQRIRKLVLNDVSDASDVCVDNLHSVISEHTGFAISL